MTGFLVLGAALTGCMKSESDDDPGDPTSSGNGASGPGAGAAGGAGNAGAGGNPTASGGGGSGGGSTLTACSTTQLLLGNPYFTGDLEGWNPDGQPLLADPPLRNRHIAVHADNVFVETQYEVWMTEGANVRRVAGDEFDPVYRYDPAGDCADVRFITASGVTTLPNGNVVVTDSIGNGVVELSGLPGACTAKPIAGNAVAIEDVDIGGDVADPGDVDGPDATAKTYGPELPVSDEDGNIYFIDGGNSKIKKIANDAARTVTTLHDFASVDEASPLAMTAFGGKLYVVGVEAVSDFLWAIGTDAPGQFEEVFNQVGTFEEIGTSTTATMNGLTNDGEALIVGSAKGYIFRLSTSGEQLATLAGTGQVVDFPPDLDFAAGVPANETPIKAISTIIGSVARKGNSILYAGTAAGVGFHVLDIACE
ncbi:MAG: hypothetical protein WKG00_09845 [Polyangiaceae bacterium]